MLQLAMKRKYLKVRISELLRIKNRTRPRNLRIDYSVYPLRVANNSNRTDVGRRAKNLYGEDIIASHLTLSLS